METAAAASEQVMDVRRASVGVRRRLGLVLLPLPLVLLGGCTNLASLLGMGPPPEPPPQAPLPPIRAEQPPQTAPADGLAPLPTPQQVLTSVPFGRQDPFAPLPSTQVAGGPGGPGGAPAAPTSAPPGFVLNGVLRGGRGPEALVTYGGSTGSLRPGDRGGEGKLLPQGWTLQSVAFGGRGPMDSPSVTLLYGGQRVKVTL